MKLSLTMITELSDARKYVRKPREVVVHWEVSTLERHNITVRNTNTDEIPVVSINRSGELIWEGTFEELESKLKSN